MISRANAFVVSCLVCGVMAHGASLPAVRQMGDATQLIVDGKPYLILGGELGNSSAGTAAQADEILPKLVEMHLNTVLMPVAWEQIEPVEGTFDFTILDHWIDVARQEHLHLVLLWFGSWKNSVSSYTPAWVKEDTARFPRAMDANGSPLEILSTLGEQTQKADGRAFSSLMKHVRDVDEGQQTVLMVQVENEVGYLGYGRDRSKAANEMFRLPVPSELMHALEAKREELSPELRARFRPEGKSWQEVFGEAADEVFMAWNYARYIQAVAADGKRAYVALNAANTLGVIDLSASPAKLAAQIPVGNVPNSVVIHGNFAYISNEGGRPATAGDFTNDSDGTPIVVDRTDAFTLTGTVSVVDLTTGKLATSIR